jgi:lipopolysaccharide/colanic/teichoic acid biosynthesis glycosyltransferase
MKQKNDYSMAIRLTRPLLHIIIVILIFYLIYRLRLITDLIPGLQLVIPYINYHETMMFAAISWIIFVCIWIIKNLYELHKPIQNYFQTFSKVWIYRIITITFISYFWSWILFTYWLSRFIIVIWWITTYIALFLFDQIRNKLESQIHKNWNNKIIIIWDNSPNSYEIIDKIQSWFSFKTEFIQLDDLNDIDISKYFIVIAAWIFPRETLQEIFEQTRYTNTRFYHISEWYFLEDVVYKPEHISNLIAMEYKHSKLDWWSIVLKRIFDIITSSVAIILLSPIMLIIWILIKIDSKWPVFFTQKRVWLHGKEFTFIKFRSMVQDAESLKKDLIKQNERKWPLFKIKNDPRITKFWKFLRKTSIDELPQLFCVLIWTMSLIWPRPHLPEEVEKYENREKRLLSIKPWISWYAQVFGRDNLSFAEEARLDLYYIQNRSIFLDLYVIITTFKVIFKGK